MQNDQTVIVIVLAALAGVVAWCGQKELATGVVTGMFAYLQVHTPPKEPHP